MQISRFKISLASKMAIFRMRFLPQHHYIEYNEKIERFISEELGIQQEKVQSIE